jgi:hypothetical protein
MTAVDMAELASFISRALTGSPEAVADDVAAWRAQFQEIYFTTDKPVVNPRGASPIEG